MYGKVVGAATGLIHGYLGEQNIFSVARIEPRYVKVMARLEWQCGAVAWVVIGILLIAAASFVDDDARRSVIIAAFIIYLTGAVGNAVATRGKHFGWVVLTAAIILAAMGW
jgi:hypothetical protein